MAPDQNLDKALDLFRSRAIQRGDVVDLILFGSRARGDARAASDADLAVVLKQEHDPDLETRFAFADLAFDVLLETGILIEPHAIAEAHWQTPDRHSNPALLRRIAREGRPIGVTV